MDANRRGRLLERRRQGLEQDQGHQLENAGQQGVHQRQRHVGGGTGLVTEQGQQRQRQAGYRQRQLAEQCPDTVVGGGAFFLAYHGRQQYRRQRQVGAEGQAGQQTHRAVTPEITRPQQAGATERQYRQQHAQATGRQHAQPFCNGHPERQATGRRQEIDADKSACVLRQQQAIIDEKQGQRHG